MIDLQPVSNGSGAQRWAIFAAITTALFLANHDFFFSDLARFSATTSEVSESLAGGDLLRRLAYLGLAGLGIVLFALRPRLSRVGLVGTLLLLYFVWSAASVIWSVDPPQTIRRIVVVACLLVSAVGITRSMTLADLRTFLIFNGGIILFVGVLAEIVLGNFAPLSSEHRFSGTLHPNQQGVSCTLLVLAAASLARERGTRFRGLLWALLLAGLVGLTMTRSRTALVTCLVGLFVIYAPQLSRWKRGGLVLALYFSSALTLAALLLFVDGLIPFIGDVATLGRPEAASANLTGRVPLWGALSSYILDHPLQGHGFEAFWNPSRVFAVSTAAGWTVSSAHSVYVDLLLHLGVVGFALFVGTLAALMVAMIKSPQTGEKRLVLAILVFGALQGVLETALLGPNILFFAFLWASVNTGLPATEAGTDRVRLATHGSLRSANRLALRR